MLSTRLRHTSALTSAAFAALVLSAAPAFAQTAPAPTDSASPSPTPQAQPADAPTGDQEIVVTGSRIRSPNLTGPNPVTTLQGDAFFQTGSVSIGDRLNQLPQLASTFSQSNSTRFLGTSGLNLLDLRQLGTQRTLVLVNGRRHVAGDILNSGTSVNTNTIPTDLIEKVDIVTGGESAVYGSDAIAGVVNFVLKTITRASKRARRAASAAMVTAPRSSRAYSPARISTTAAATSRSISNMPIRTSISAAVVAISTPRRRSSRSIRMAAPAIRNISCITMSGAHPTARPASSASAAPPA